MGSHPPDPDLGRLLRLAAEGDPDAWRDVVERYSPRVFGLLLSQCGDRSLAEEITQDTFVKIVAQMCRFGRYEEQGKFEPWLFRIAMNGLRDEMRRRKRQARPWSSWSARDAQHEEPQVDRAADPLEQVSRDEQIELLRAAVSQLNESDQQILHLRHTAGLTFPQIAETLGEPLGTVLARGHRALQKVRKLMNEGETRQAS